MANRRKRKAPAASGARKRAALQARVFRLFSLTHQARAAGQTTVRIQLADLEQLVLLAARGAA